MNEKLTFAQRVADGIYTIDTGFERDCFAASYLVLNSGKAAFIDVGTNYSATRLVKTLEELHISVNDVEYIILTHVHLDHAGGAGEMMRRCPNSKLIVHPRGARHMIDPTALRAGAVAVYAEDVVQKKYGNLLPIDPSRVEVVYEGNSIDLAARSLNILDTPGHAKHHIAIWDQRSDGVFTGDTFGLSYREFDTENGAFIIPTTTPVQFDPFALEDSVSRIAALSPVCIFPTHFSRVNDVQRIKSLFLKQLSEMVELSIKLKDSDNRHEKLKFGLTNIYVKNLMSHGCTKTRSEIETFLKIDIELNAQGIGVWLDKR